MYTHPKPPVLINDLCPIILQSGISTTDNTMDTAGNILYRATVIRLCMYVFHWICQTFTVKLSAADLDDFTYNHIYAKFQIPMLWQ